MCWLSNGKPSKSAGRCPLNLLAQGSITSVSGLRSGGCGFDARPNQTKKTLKMVLAALSFALSIEKAGLVSPMSV